MPYKVNDPDAPARPVIDDEQLKRMMNANTPGFFERNRFRLVTLVLIALNVIVFAAEAAISLLAGARMGVSLDIPTRVLVDMGAMYAPLVQAGELFRFVTPMFLHMDLMHLGFNMVALFSVGEVLERVLGRGNFLALYLFLNADAVQHLYRLGTDSIIHGIQHIITCHLIFIDRITLGKSLHTNTLAQLLHIVNLFHPLAVDHTQKNDTLDLTEGIRLRELRFFGCI